MSTLTRAFRSVVRPEILLFALVAPASAPAQGVIEFSTPALTLMRPNGSLGEIYGQSVAGAGDVNGDGFADVIVGAPQSSIGGRAFIYFGGPNADTAADVVLSGTNMEYLGNSVSGAGDVNGDGYADVIVGAYENAVAGGSAGRAYVYFGGPHPDSTPDLTLNSEGANNYFGACVAGAGDVNGDGYGDVIVGAYGNSTNGPDAGRAYVYFGGYIPDAIADLTLTGAATGDYFGYAADGAGDVNGDGFDDAIVGAMGNDSGGIDAGRAYVFYGGVSPDALADVTLTGAAPNDNFGISVAGIGDVNGDLYGNANGDGYADVIVGAYGNDMGGADAGSAYVFYGGVPPDPFADLVLVGAAPGDYFGLTVSGAGDFNGDGSSDWIVGAFQNDASGINGGRVYAYLGGPNSTDASADLILSGGGGASEFFGISLAGAGDVNGDGWGDLIVGATGKGRAYVMTAKPYAVQAPNGGEQWIAGREATVRWLGSARADLYLSSDGGATYSLIASRVGGSESNALTVTAPGPDTRLAKVRVTVAGTAPTIANADASDRVFSIVSPVTPPAAAARLQLALPPGSWSVSGAGDVNGDGYPDLVVGNPSGVSPGSAYVYFGGPSADAVADRILTGTENVDYFGFTVAGVGDVNGDGFDEVLVGARYAGGGGRAYLYLGGPMFGFGVWTLMGEGAFEAFGFRVAGAGDVNGDGYADFLVGAIANDAGGTDAGRAYLYFGGPFMDGNPDLVLTGEKAGDGFGIVARGGDLNGDGYDDVVVGAGNEAGGAGAGRVYVFHGGPGIDSRPDLVITGDVNEGLVPSAAVGDVNGDRYCDLAVGAYVANAGAGRVDVHFGGPSMDNVPDLTWRGEAAGDEFGVSISGGDVNVDGYADVIVGGMANKAGAGNGGRAYVFFGGPGADADPDLVFTGTIGGNFFGQSVSFAGDVNGDGFPDVLVGSNSGGYLYDVNRYHLTSPVGGETWNVGATKTISWLGSQPADIWLSVDGGNSYQLEESRVGGAATNKVLIRVPHTPTKFARLKITPSDTDVRGSDRSDSLFTIQTSVALLALMASPLPEGGASLTWNTDPGPEDLAGYRVERASAGAVWSTLVPLTRETSVTDPAGGPGVSYRLYAVNGFGEELELGETTIRPRANLAAWPTPYRGGTMAIGFATYGGLGGGRGDAELSLYDVHGRLVRVITRGDYPAGYQSAVWDGRDERGDTVGAGVYFLRSKSAGQSRTMKITVLR